jgi:hypothetical protein
VWAECPNIVRGGVSNHTDIDRGYFLETKFVAYVLQMSVTEVFSLLDRTICRQLQLHTCSLVIDEQDKFAIVSLDDLPENCTNQISKFQVCGHPLQIQLPFAHDLDG